MTTTGTTTTVKTGFAAGSHMSNRLTPADMGAIHARILQVLDLWPVSPLVLDATARLALRRVGAAAIGCSEDDLRPAELAAIDALAAR